MHGKFAAAKVSTFVVSDFCVVWDFDCQRLCITPLGRCWHWQELHMSSPINAMCRSLVRETSAALPIFHCYTGCDTISAFCGKGKKSAWEAWSSYPEVTQAFNYMAANRHSPLTTDGHTSNFWSATQSSFTTRRDIRFLSMKHEESCSARGTKRWNTSIQLKIPCCSSQNELPTSLEYGRHVNWPISRHPVQKDVDGRWMETAM